MKNLIVQILIIFIISISNSQSQNLIINENNQGDGVFFCELKSGRITNRVKLPIKAPQYIIYWGAQKNNVYGTDGNNIYSLDFTTKKTSIIYTSKEWINNFFVRNKHVYFTVTLTPNVDENEGRYVMKKHKIIVLDCIKKNVLKQIIIPFDCNVIGLSVSPNEQKIVFVNTLNIDDKKKTKYELVGFDSTTKKKEIYDVARYSNYQWFVESNSYNSVSWENNDVFYYLKKDGKGNNKGVLKYNSSNQISKKIFDKIPQRDIDWFVWDKTLLYSNRKNIISFDGKIEKIIYKHDSDSIGIEACKL
jgi:hypothetical protein